MERRGQRRLRFPKPKVTGSSPVGTANNFKSLRYSLGITWHYFGTSVTDVAKTLIEEGIRQAVKDGFLNLRQEGSTVS